MKVQCSCGAKYEFTITPEMANRPVTFVCPGCGLNASEFVDGLIRRELGQSASPTGVPIPIGLSAPPSAPAGATPQPAAPPPPRAASPVRLTRPAISEPATAVADNREGVRCLKHPGEVATEKCCVCSKPICPKCTELFGYVCSPLCKAKAESHGITVPVYEAQKSVAEARLWRKVRWVGAAVGAVLLGLAGFWFWYSWFGSTPRTFFSVRFAEPAYSGQSVIGGPEKDQIVFLHGGTLARYDMKLKQPAWSLELLDTNALRAEAEQELKLTKERMDKLSSEKPDLVLKPPSFDKILKEMTRSAAAGLALYVRGRNIWVTSPGKIVRYDWDSGKTAKELTLLEGSGGILARGDEVLMVKQDSGSPVVTHINLVSGELRNEELAAPELKAVASAAAVGPAAKGGRSAPAAGLPTGAAGQGGGKGMDPAKVAQQAQNLSLPARIALPATLALNMAQERTMRELDAPERQNAAGESEFRPRSSFSLVPTQAGFVEFGVKVLEARTVTRGAMKAAPSRSALENATAGNSLDAASELLNDMQRSRGGDKITEDVSRYEVTLRRPGAETGWTGEVIGPPTLYPLQTVTVLSANKLILVFDNTYKKLWQSTLNYNLAAGFGALDPEHATFGLGPCVEHKGLLFTIDEGVLTAFDLATGNARWRYPSVGITGIFFDDQDMIYVNSTTASHEKLKYSRQIDLSQKDVSVALKLDSRNGKVLWSTQLGGLINYVSGKYIFMVQSYAPAEEEADNPYQVDTGFEKTAYLRIRRINPVNGHEMWQTFQERAPLDIGFDRNTIRLVFKQEVQVLKFLSF